MTSKKKTIHLICNAHLDPVWLWQWEEGAATAMSTFRVAAELCEKHSEFIFNHNEVTLYQWVQQYEPVLFERIRKLVKAGRWHIMGGWYLQPDCNMPSGESFVRQILLGREYFRSNFGVEPSTAINFDPFGHTRGLVQIMAKSGFNSYLFGRPDPKWLKLPAEDFVWRGYDGSQIIARRFSGWYNSPLGQARRIVEERIEQVKDENCSAILWGVGNHGGGPSKKDVADLEKLIRQRKDVDIRHSTPERYFKELSNSGRQLPTHAADLNPWGVGCYTSMIRVKRHHRLLENEYYMTEKMVSAAASQGLMNYPSQELHDALRDLMMGEFHDVIPGSSIAPVEEAALRTMDHGLEILSAIKARAFFALSTGQKKSPQGQVPILVYNPHPYKVKAIIECEFNLPDFNLTRTFTNATAYKNGKPLPSQMEQEYSNIPIDLRKHVVFAAELEPAQMNRFDCHLNLIKAKPSPKLKIKNGKISFKTRDLEVVINARTGFVDRFRAGGIDQTAPNAFVPLVMADNEDPWGMLVKSFREIVGRFKLMDKKSSAKFAGNRQTSLDPVHVIEDGDVRSVIEVLLQFDNSYICQRYKLPKVGTEIEVEMDVHWNQKNQMLKLSIPTLDPDARYLGQVAYGIGELPADGSEAVAQKWVAVVSKKSNRALTCINDGIYGSDFSREGLCLSLLRSPAYSAHPIEGRDQITVQDRYIPHIDQGQRLFKFWFNAGTVKKRLESIDREALAKNEKPFALSFFPSGQGKQPKPFAILSDDVVQITAIKKAQKGDDYIVRVFEPTGKPRTAILSLPLLEKRIKLALGAFEIKTLRINAKTDKVFETDLMERKAISKTRRTK